jgi:hypothetical protein
VALQRTLEPLAREIAMERELAGGDTELSRTPPPGES